jgi:serine/threonine protein kinase
MITNEYYVKIVDFGMAKRVNSAYIPQSDSNLVGTLPYMVI